MNAIFSAVRSDAMRAQLEEEITKKSPSIHPRPGWMMGTALLVTGLLTGGTVSAAAVTSLLPASPLDLEAAEQFAAPPGVLPGMPIVSLLGETSSYEISGEMTFELSEPPDGATHISTTFTCLTPGEASWGTSPVGSNPTLSCSDADVLAGTGVAGMDFPLPVNSRQFFAQTRPAERGILVVQYVNYVPTELGRNAAGETYGAAWEGLTPDLVAVSGLAPDGSSVIGYARATQLTAFGPDWPGQPSSPKQALEWQRERDERYPDGWEIPVYASDGRTVLGSFLISN